jgi:hypothetical protein
MKGRIEDLNLDKKKKYKVKTYSYKGFNYYYDDYVTAEGILVYTHSDYIEAWHFLSNDNRFMGDRCEYLENQSEFKYSWVMVDDEYDTVEILGTHKPNPWQGSKLIFTMP